VISLQRALAAHDAAQAGAAGLKLQHYRVLQAVARLPAATPARVADAVGLRRSTMTGVLDSLERKGLLTRERSTTDRRSVLLRCTDEGRSHVAVEPLADVAIADADAARLAAALREVADLLALP
jgi:DNA-binding MarR family transcriptional regulator